MDYTLYYGQDPILFTNNPYKLDDRINELEDLGVNPKDLKVIKSK